MFCTELNIWLKWDEQWKHQKCVSCRILQVVDQPLNSFKTVLHTKFMSTISGGWNVVTDFECFFFSTVVVVVAKENLLVKINFISIKMKHFIGARCKCETIELALHNQFAHFNATPYTNEAMHMQLMFVIFNGEFQWKSA